MVTWTPNQLAFIPPLINIFFLSENDTVYCPMAQLATESTSGALVPLDMEICKYKDVEMWQQ